MFERFREFVITNAAAVRASRGEWSVLWAWASTGTGFAPATTKTSEVACLSCYLRSMEARKAQSLAFCVFRLPDEFSTRGGRKVERKQMPLAPTSRSAPLIQTEVELDCELCVGAVTFSVMVDHPSEQLSADIHLMD